MFLMYQGKNRWDIFVRNDWVYLTLKKVWRSMPGLFNTCINFIVGFNLYVGLYWGKKSNEQIGVIMKLRRKIIRILPLHELKSALSLSYLDESSIFSFALNPSPNPSDSAKSFTFSSTTKTKSIFLTPSLKKVVGSSFPKQTSKLTPWSCPCFVWTTCKK